ncbi:MAG: GIY-YIG nuclease family protein [Fimbriimonas sp.]|nr:GIY-YIG nuclease family protein [Fimbriimonas sp.]
MSPDIPLGSILELGNQESYKLHVANWNGSRHPIDDFTESFESWMGWNRWRGTRNDFSRRHIFSLIRIPFRHSMWLFGGIFDVQDRLADRYVLNVNPLGESLIGRLVVDLTPPKGRGRAYYLEKYFDQMKLHEILSKPYEGVVFNGYDRIHLTFRELANIVSKENSSWRVALENAKGVYLITDRKTGRAYVGSAYGSFGIWSRWQSYVATGHGGNVELRELVSSNSDSYVRENFSFALLEHILPSASDEFVLGRESFWKQVLLTRDFGYNSN